MDKKGLEGLLNKAYEKYQWELSQWAKTATEIEKKKYEIGYKEAGLLLGDTIDGKNQAIRDAQMKMAMKPDYDVLFDMEQDEMVKKTRKEMAEIQLHHARALLRVAELTEVEDELE